MQMEYEDNEGQSLLDKTILIVGEVINRKRYVWEVARQNGIKVIYIDTDKDASGKINATNFFQLDLSDHTKDELNAEIISDLFKSRGINIDGCLTFHDDFIVLVALIAAKLGLCSPGLDGSRITKSKHDTHKYLDRDPDVIDTRHYATHTYRICNKNDIISAILNLRFPAIIKPEYGRAAWGTRMVSDVKECLNVFEKQQCLYNSLEGTGNKFGICHGRSMVIMEYIDGTEHDINVIMFKGSLVDAFVTDNGPTRNGTFFETASSMPTCLPDKKKEELIQAAYLCCAKLGLSSGVFNVEMKMTENGPKLLEINARLPGFCSRDWILQLFGVDLLKCAFLITCGIQPFVPIHVMPYSHMMGVVCVDSIHKEILKCPGVKRQLQQLCLDKKIQYIDLGENSWRRNGEQSMDGLCCYISVKEESLEIAKQKLLEVCDDLEINCPEYPVKHFLKHFQSFN